MDKFLQGKSIALIIAFRNFRDEEYFIPRDVFSRTGARVATVSAEKGIAIGVNGGEADVDLILENLDPSDFDALVFVGGEGAIKYLDNDKSYEIARRAMEANKILAAICVAPVILAKAGVLKGKKTTVWSTMMDKSAIKILKENGAIYRDEPVASDGRVITANGPAAAKKFAERITEMLAS